MRESYVKGLAAHNGPESCGGVRKGVAEALTGVRAGRVFSRENTLPLGRRRRERMRKATFDTPLMRGVPKPHAVRDPAHVRKHLAREPGDPRFTGPDGRAGRVGKFKDSRR
jgi:hypothetical protein